MTVGLGQGGGKAGVSSSRPSWPIGQCVRPFWCLNFFLALREKQNVPGWHVESRWTLGKLEETSLVIQWLGLQASNAQGTGSTLGWEIKIPHALRCGSPKFSF